MRTMVALLQAGVLDRCQTLPHEIDAETFRIALRGPGGPVHQANFRKRLASLVDSGLRPDLQAIIAEHLEALEAQTVSAQGTAEREPRQRRWERLIAKVRE